MERSGAEWSGVERSGAEWQGVERRRKRSGRDKQRRRGATTLRGEERRGEERRGEERRGAGCGATTHLPSRLSALTRITLSDLARRGANGPAAGSDE